MKLYEFEGHKILAKVGVESPFFVVAKDIDDVKEARKRIKFPIVAKVQVLSGKRGKSGGVKIATTEKALISFCGQMFGADFPPSPSSFAKASDDKKSSEDKYGETVEYISLSEMADTKEEFYASITYDTVKAIPFLLFSKKGGMDIEEVKKQSPNEISRVDIDPLAGLTEKSLKNLVGKDNDLVDFLIRLWDGFVRYDCRLLEINPIAKVADGYLAVDAKIILDDNGLARHKDLDVLSKGAAGAKPKNIELEAKKIDAEDYRGSAGSTFIELDGDIAILASGGGASLLVMDAVVDNGGKPANYTEYSGNPPGEKVEKLTKITLSREGLNGCLVAGAVANFTDIYETLTGFAQGLKSVTPKVAYPIVIRRGGPRQKEAYEFLEKFAKKEGFDIHLFGPETPISVACKEMVELSEKFKNHGNIS